MDREGLRVALAVGVELGGEIPREERRAAAAPPAAAPAASTAGDWQPDDTVHAGGRRERRRRNAPERGRVRNAGPAAASAPPTTSTERYRRAFGRERLQHRAAGVENLDRDRTGRVLLQVVVDDRAVRRILGLRLVLLQRGAVVSALLDRDRVGWLEEEGVGRQHRIGDLTERADVVDHPDTTAVRADDEIVAIDLEIAHRSDGQVELDRLPVVAVVERHERAALGAGEEQALAHVVFFDRVDVDAGRESGRDPLPGLAEVARAIDVGLEVLELVPVDAGVGDVLIEVRRFDHRHATPRRDRRRRDIVPRLAVVARDLNETIVGADPDHWHENGRWRDGVDDAALAVAIDLRGRRGVERGRHARIGAREIVADLRPALGAV